MIKTFACKETKRLFARHRVKKIPRDIERGSLRKLVMIDAAVDIRDLRVPPGNKLKQLRGGRKTEWSIRINAQWRACFTWKNGNAYDVRIEDYH